MFFDCCYCRIGLITMSFFWFSVGSELVSAVVEQNTPEIASSCLRTIVTYINNIIKVKCPFFAKNPFYLTYLTIPLPFSLPGPHGTKVPNHQAEQQHSSKECLTGPRWHRLASLRASCIHSHDLVAERQFRPTSGAVGPGQRDSTGG